jgi:hypothetical protein
VGRSPAATLRSRAGRKSRFAMRSRFRGERTPGVDAIASQHASSNPSMVKFAPIRSPQGLYAAG